MKKMLYIFPTIIALVGIIWLIVLALSDRPEENKTDDTVQVTDIEIKDANQTALYNSTYIFTGSVYAVYEDGSKSNVTSSATVTGVDTSVLSTQTATVTYLTFTKTFEVEIIQTSVDSLELNKTNAKIVYKVGETFSKEGLVVTKISSADSKDVISNYTVKIYNDLNTEVSISNPFTEEGIYNVVISHQDINANYNIIVHTAAFAQSDLVNPSDFYNNYLMTKGVYTFSASETEIINSDLTDVFIKGTNSSIRTVYFDGTAINVQYDNTTYNACLALGDQSSTIKISVLDQSIIKLVVSSSDRNGLLVKNSSGDVVQTVGDVSQSPSLVCFSAEADTYEITPVEDEVYFYNISANYESIPTPEVTSIVLDTTNVKKVFEYGEIFEYNNLVVKTNTNVILNSNEYRYELSLNEVTKTTLDEAGEYTVKVIYLADESITASYTITVNEEVITPEITSIVLDTTNVKKVFEYGEVFEYDNLVVKTNTDTILDSNEYRCQLSLNGVTKTSLEEVGQYNVLVIYLGNGNITASYTITVNEEVPEVTSIVLDTTNVKKVFEYEEIFEYDNLVVKTNTNVTLNSNEYRYELSLNGVTKTTLDVAGEYTVKVIYLADESITASYTITVNEEVLPENNITINFGYSGFYADPWEKTINLNAPINPEDYIQAPNGYVFTGFSEVNWNDLKNNDFIKVYVEPKKTNQYIIAYLTSNYERYKVAYVTRNANATPITTHPEVAGKIFTGWDTSRLSPVTSDIYVLPNYVNDGGTFDASISFSSDTSVTLALNLDSSNSYEYNLKVTTSSYERNITALSATLTDLKENTSYTISGYVTYLRNNQKYIISFEESTFSTSVYSELQNITEDACTIEEYSNGITVETSGFVNNAPTGYELDSIALYHNDELVEEIFYEVQETITFFDLETGEEYRVDAFYKPAQVQVRSILRIANNTITPGYRIHFVGFQVFCNSETELYRINLMYKGELLYKMYFGANEKIDDKVFRFMLPIKYENLTIVGSLDYEETINSNVEWEVVLLDLDATNLDKYTVVFYERHYLNNVNYINIIKDIQEVNSEEDAVPPTYSDYTSVDGKKLYTFTGFSSIYTNIDKNLILYPTYKETTIVPVDAEYEVAAYVSPISIHPFSVEIKSENAYVSSSYYIIGGEYTVKTKLEYKQIFIVSPNTEYTITIEYSYKNQYNELIEKTNSLVITTPNESKDSTNDITSAKSIYASYYNFAFKKGTVKSIEMYETSGLTTDNYRMRSIISGDSISIENLKQNTSYEVIYYLNADDSTRIYYSYYCGQLLTLDAQEPIIEKILVSDEIDILVFLDISSNIQVEVNYFFDIPEIPNTLPQQRSTSITAEYVENGLFTLRWREVVYDPETGEPHEYFTYLTRIFIRYSYNGKIHEIEYSRNSSETEIYEGKEYSKLTKRN